jgi:dihydropteroate synthase
VSTLDAQIEAFGPEARVPLREQLARLTTPLPAWGAFNLDRPHLMGVLNVTPDSFSDGGDFFDDAAQAIDHGHALSEAGADIIDIGGESTRPGAAPVSADEEMARVVPVVRKLASAGIAVSIDTRHAVVMGAALDAGARIVNDISGLADPGTLPLIRQRQAPCVIMHMQGEPGTMQKDPRYGAAPLDVFDYLDGRLAVAEAAGVPRSLCLIDPGIGFGKALTHNLDLMAMLGLYRSLGCGILLGASRKSMVQHVMGGDLPPKARVPGSLALALAALEGGAAVIRVHDVAETAQALAVWQAVRARG